MIFRGAAYLRQRSCKGTIKLSNYQTIWRDKCVTTTFGGRSVVDGWSIDIPIKHQQTIIAQHVTKNGGRVVEKYATCACAHIHVCVCEKHAHPTCHTSPATPMSHCPTLHHPWMLFGILNYSKPEFGIRLCHKVNYATRHESSSLHMGEWLFMFCKNRKDFLIG